MDATREPSVPSGGAPADARTLAELVEDCERMAPMSLGPGPRFPRERDSFPGHRRGPGLRIGGRAAFEAGATGLVGLPVVAERGRRLLPGLEDYGC